MTKSHRSRAAPTPIAKHQSLQIAGQAPVPCHGFLRDDLPYFTLEKGEQQQQQQHHVPCFFFNDKL